MFREWLREYQTELIVAVIGIGVSLAVSIALTGNLDVAEAGRHRR
jgi:hypothetical protein